MKQIAIIGAGMSGLALASFLQDKATITLFDKSRGVSGRMSTRYADPYQYDHGAQFFTARTRAFQDFLEPYIASGCLSEWKPNLVILEKGKEPIRKEWSQPRYIPLPRMNAWCKEMAASHNVHLGTQISHLEKEGGQWNLHTEQGDSFGPFDWVLCSAPAPQTQKILPKQFCHHEQLGKVKMTGCFTLMLGFEKPLIGLGCCDCPRIFLGLVCRELTETFA